LQDVQKVVGRKIKAIRDKKGVTQDQLINWPSWPA